jgi:hypothetical protein
MNSLSLRSFFLTAVLACTAIGTASAQDITTYCFGTATACPCSNPGTQGAGCMNSFGTAGKMIGSGTASLSGDTVTLTVGGLPVDTTIVYFHGTGPANHGLGTVFGDGLMCVAGDVARIAVRTANSSGVSSLGFGVSGDQALSVLSNMQVAETRYYTGWYRNAIDFCTPSAFNLSNGVAVDWQP